MQKTVIYLVTEDGYFCSHRLSLARAAKAAGYRVIVATKVSNHHEELQSEGFEVINIPFVRGRLNPFIELMTFIKIVSVYSKLRPDIAHHVALKPVIYGSIAAALLRFPCRLVNMLGGLGYVFTASSLKASLLKPLVKLGLRLAHLAKNAVLIIQNKDDMAELSKIIAADKLRLIPGSGVDTEALQPRSAENNDVVRVSLVGRMLWTKGIGELVEAQKVLQRNGVTVEIELVGDTDTQNPEHITREVLQSWQAEKLIKWHGQRSDVADIYIKSDIAILPSYREGLPKSLLEAASLGKPIITTDVPGCRDVIEDGVSGILVPLKDHHALAAAINKLASSKKLRDQMGQKARDRAVAVFDIARINQMTLELYMAD